MNIELVDERVETGPNARLGGRQDTLRWRHHHDRRAGRATVAAIGIGSASDNRAGGWYAYRASKAALNQLVRTAGVELARRSPEALCIALHPGTVATPLSAPYGSAHLEVHTPDVAANHLLAVIDGLTEETSGGFF